MQRVIPVNLGFVYSYIVSGDNGAVLVDCGFPGDEMKILQALKANDIPKESVRLIIITHADPDHYGSAAQLRKILNAPVILHEADSDMVRTGKVRKFHASGIQGMFLKLAAGILTRMRMKKYIPFEPDIIMSEEIFSLQPYGIDGYLLHTPGETQGSISAVLENKKIIIGDLISGVIPHSAVPAYAPFSDNMGDVRKSLSKILSLQPLMLYTGHSKPIDVQKHMGKLKRLSIY